MWVDEDHQENQFEDIVKWNSIQDHINQSLHCCVETKDCPIQDPSDVLLQPKPLDSHRLEARKYLFCSLIQTFKSEEAGIQRTKANLYCGVQNITHDEIILLFLGFIGMLCHIQPTNSRQRAFTAFYL